MKKVPRVARWFRWTAHWDRLLEWSAKASVNSWEAIYGWLTKARAPHCLVRKPVSLDFESLETRFVMTTVSFTSATYTIGEGGGTATISVMLDDYPSGTVTVDYATSDDTAIAGRDYTSNSGTLTFTTSDLVKTFTISVTNDAISEANEAITLTLSNPSGADLAAPDTATLTITDQDYVVPTATSNPRSITVGPDGLLWFLEKDANKVAKMTTAGSFTEYTIPTGDSEPYQITVGADGNLWFTEYGADKIAKVTTGGTITEYSLISSQNPSGIALGSDGNIWFVATNGDYTHPVVGKITPAGTITEYVLEDIQTQYEEYALGAIAAGPDGNLWVSVYTTPNSNLAKMSVAGVPTYYSSELRLALAIAAGPDGNLWFGSTAYNRIGRITPFGDVTEFNFFHGVGVSDIAIGPDGAIYYASPSTQGLARVTTDGQSVFFDGITGTGPTHLVFGPDGNLWYTDGGSNKIGRFSGFATSSAFTPDHIDKTDEPLPIVSGHGSVALSVATGDITVSHDVEDDQTADSDSMCCAESVDAVSDVVGDDLALTMSSDAVASFPILQVSYQSDPGDSVPTQLEARYKWNGGSFSGWTTFGTSGHAAGDNYALALQVASEVTATGYYDYTFEVRATYGSEVITRAYDGKRLVVAIGSSSPFGAGWSLVGLDRLVPVDDGVIYVYGSGGGRYFQAIDSETFVSPANDEGTLVFDDGTDLYTYTTRGQVEYIFDDDGYLMKVVDPNSLVHTYLYDGGGRVTAILDPDGSTATFTYSSGKLTKIEAPGSRTTTVTVDGSGDLTQIINPDGGVRSFAYDGSHRLTNDQFGGQSVTYAYDPGNGTLTTIQLDALATVTLSAANTKALTTATAKNKGDIVGTLTDPRGTTGTFTFDGAGRLTKGVVPTAGTTTITRDFAGQPTAIADPKGNVTQYEYLYGAAAGDLQSVTQADGATYEYAYDATFHKPTVTTDQLGAKTTYTYNATTGNLETIKDAQNNVTTYVWSSGLLESVKRPNGAVTTYTYDGARRRETVKDPSGAVVTYQYDAAGNMTGMVDAAGGRTTMTYDKMGRRLSTERPGTAPTTTMYDVVGRVTASISSAGVETRYTYNALGLPVATTVGYGSGMAQTTTNLYDVSGNVTGTVDALGNLTQYVVDSLGRTTATVDPLGNRATTIYDVAGNATVMIDALNQRTTYLVDSMNRSTVTINALNQRTTVLYDAAGHVTGSLDALSNLTAYVYDAVGRQTVTVSPLGSRVTTLYDNAGQVTGSLDARGNLMAYVYDAAGRQTVTVTPLGARVTTLLDAAGRTTGSLDALNNLTQYVYDASGRQTVTIDALGSRVTTLFDSAGRVTGSLDPLGNLSQYVYDALGRQTATVDPLGNRVTSVLDAANRATVSIDARGFRTTMQYDVSGRATVSIDALNQRTTSLFDAAGRVTQVTNARGNSTQYVYDAIGRQTVTIDAQSNRMTMVYDAAGRATVSIDALNRRTTTQFDADGRASVTIDTLNQRTTSLYDVAGNVTQMTNARGFSTQYVYDADGRASVTVDALTNRTTVLFDKAGNATAVIDARNNRTSYVYDALNRATVSIDALNKRTTTLFDAAGRVTGNLDANGNLYQHQYDAAGRETVTIDPLTYRTTMTYLATGQLESRKDPNGNLITYQYDAVGRQTVTIDQLNNLTTTSYDAVGNMTSLKDASNNLTTFAYDSLDRKTGETDPLGKRATFSYNAVGLMTESIDRLGRKRQFQYDATNQLTVETWLSAAGATVTINTFTYDAVGNQLSAQNGYGTYTMTYDAMNRVTVSKDVWNQTLTMTYDAVGNRTQVVDSFGGVTTSVYDAANQLTLRDIALTTTTALRIDLTYQNNGLLDTLNRYSDLTGSTKIGAATYLYDAVNRMTSLYQRNGAGTVLASYVYAFDAGSRVTSEVINGGTRTFSYDNADQLTADSTNTYTYDATGNRNNGSWTTTTGNRLTGDGTWTYTYDDEGNLTKKSKGSSLETWFYAYDHRNQMTSAEKRATDNPAGTLQLRADYKYDVYGNRIQKAVDSNGDSVVDSTERYSLDGWNTAKPRPIGTENWDVWADLDGASSLTTRYMRGDAVDQVFGRVTSGTAAWLLTDRLGSLRDVTDNTGVLRDTIAYDGYGNIASETDSNWGGRYKWTGRESDSETGLQYNRARYYDTKAGRWTSQDPLGFDAGDSNLHRYASNTFILTDMDPSGLAARPALQGDYGGIKVKLENPEKRASNTGLYYVLESPWRIYFKLSDKTDRLTNYEYTQYITNQITVWKGYNQLDEKDVKSLYPDTLFQGAMRPWSTNQQDDGFFNLVGGVKQWIKFTQPEPTHDILDRHRFLFPTYIDDVTKQRVMYAVQLKASMYLVIRPKGSTKGDDEQAFKWSYVIQNFKEHPCFPSEDAVAFYNTKGIDVTTLGNYAAEYYPFKETESLWLPFFGSAKKTKK